MTRNYVIAIGGTGARCAEAIIYLAAAGLFHKPMQILIIDPDQNNGNSVRVRTLLNSYHELQQAHQPPEAETKKFMRTAKLLPPELFQLPLNVRGGGGQHSIFWHNPNNAQRRFGEIIKYQAQEDTLKNFLDLFYEPADLEMSLDVGYRGRTNVGAVALKLDMERTIGTESNELRELIGNLNTDLQTEEARVFVMGSVFGGTGAAGLPTVPSLIAGLPDAALSKENRKKVRYGCAMMTPYFAFPKGSSVNGPGTDSTRHAIATQAALLHYAHVPPGYQHIYFIGAPTRPLTNDRNVIGGENQTNAPHYAELVAGLAAWQFFELKQIRGTDQQLHFADSLKKGKDEVGVNWDTLPVHLEHSPARETIKRRLAILTTLSYFYKNFLHPEFGQGKYQDTMWYRNNFGALSLTEDLPRLQHLYAFCDSYLGWLASIGTTGQNANMHLFHFNAFGERVQDDRQLARDFISSLLDDPSGSNAKRSKNGYDEIMGNLNNLQLTKPGTDSAAGLFIYLLHDSIAKFCGENYAWRS